MFSQLRIFPCFSAGVLSAVFFSLALLAQAQSETVVHTGAATELPPDLTFVGLERLLNFDLIVTTPSRKEQRLTDTASAIYVVTQEDIRRSSATHVAETLRLVPGVNVARVSSNRWAITVRGFNQMFANKLLVLVDGVSIFSPTTNGVYWESNELTLEDIERIEVVRGPGGALWGSNAVNGVINIVTKSSKETQGTLFSGGGGSHERGFGAARYGGKVGDDSTYRVYGTYHDRGNNRLNNAPPASPDQSARDSWQSRAGGFRFDTVLSKNDTLNLNGDFQYQTDKLFPTVPALDAPYIDSERLAGDSSWRGVRLASTWNHEFSKTSQLETKVNYSRKDRVSDLISFNYDVANLEIQHRFSPAQGHDVVYGAGYRYFYNHSEGSDSHIVNPESRGFNVENAFFQDEISILPDTLRLTLGSKFEYNDLSALAIMPNLRLLYTISPAFSAWAGISKGTASPALFFEDSGIPVQTIPNFAPGVPGLVSIMGNRQLKSESLLSTEFGARAQVTKKASFDIALFYNDYSDLISVSPQEDGVKVSTNRGRPVVEIRLTFGNSLSAHSFGGEVATELQVTESWKLIVAQSYLSLHVDLGSSKATGDKALYEGGAPTNTTMLRSLLNVSNSVQFDSTLRRVGSLSYGDVDAYTELDVRLAYKPFKNTEFALIGQNLLDAAHQEFSPNLFGLPATQIERSLFGKVTVTF